LELQRHLWIGWLSICIWIVCFQSIHPDRWKFCKTIWTKSWINLPPNLYIISCWTTFLAIFERYIGGKINKMKIYVILMFLYNFSIRLWNCSDGVVFFVFPYIRKIKCRLVLYFYPFVTFLAIFERYIGGKIQLSIW
jgi:hypothetical protein